MTCRHKRGDPACTSGNAPKDICKRAIRDLEQFGGVSVPPGSVTPAVMVPQPAAPARAPVALHPAPELPPTPDSERYQIIAAEVVGPHMVLKVKYPSCEKCSYEGIKVMVYENVTPTNVILWSRIDPHFKDPNEKVAVHEAPAPSARFPASDEGWSRALAFAKTLNAS